MRFWFPHGQPGTPIVEVEQSWRRVVLDSMRLAPVVDHAEDLARVIVEHCRVHPVFRADVQVDVEWFESWPEAEDRARVLASRSSA